MPTNSTCTGIDDQMKDHIDQNDLSKRTAPNNYRPITCLPMMWKIFTAQIREYIYYPLTSRNLFLDEQIGYCKGIRGTAELLYKDQHILNESKTKISSYGLDWLQKGLWYGFAKLGNKLPQNVQIFRWSLTLSRKLWKPGEWNWQQEEEAKLKRRSKEVFSRRCSITVTIHNCQDAT